GPIQAHEEKILTGLPSLPLGSERGAINSHYLSEEGYRELQEMLASGCYRINVPEEGALLVAAWLMAHGENETARSLLDQIGPYLMRLRFYPVPHPLPLT